jgi:3-mercaptopyruvate sulfurtransferase SseA
MTGCGGGGSSDSYDTPDSTVTAPLAGQTQNVLIDAATLKGWVDSGLVNNESSWEKVVILDVTSAASYAAGHIPGAQLWDSSAQVKNRVEGPVEAVNMTLDGASMDALVKSHGIDAGTTVVFTTTSANASSMFTLGRAYYLFRYWGFPKERLKVLNGFNKAWTDAGNALTIVAPTITASTYSVKPNPQFRADLRGSLAEVIAAVENQTMQVVDFRADGLPAGVVAGTAGWTAGVFNDDHNKDGVASQSGGDADFVVLKEQSRVLNISTTPISSRRMVISKIQPHWRLSSWPRASIIPKRSSPCAVLG